MSSNAALVLCVRGTKNQVSSAHERQLEEVYVWLERLRSKPAGGQKVSKRDRGPATELGPATPACPLSQKVLTVQSGVQDWFVGRDRERPAQWSLATGDESQLNQHLVLLHRLGIPAFFREQLQPLIMKLFVSLEAFLPEACVPTAEAQRGQFWASLKEGLLQLAVPAMAEAVAELFGRSSNMVVVLDASGWSPAAGRWKVSQRVCFVEIAVSLDTARRVRESLVRRLGGAQAAAGSDPRCSFAAGLIQAAGWERVVDERAFQRGATHRLAFCDVAHGTPPVPEERPLLPLALLRATAGVEGAAADVQQVQGADSVAPADWVDLGSTWTSQATPTDFGFCDASPSPEQQWLEAASAGPPPAEAAAADPDAAQAPERPRAAAAEAEAEAAGGPPPLPLSEAETPGAAALVGGCASEWQQPEGALPCGPGQLSDPVA